VLASRGERHPAMPRDLQPHARLPAPLRPPSRTFSSAPSLCSIPATASIASPVCTRPRNMQGHGALVPAVAVGSPGCWPRCGRTGGGRQLRRLGGSRMGREASAPPARVHPALPPAPGPTASIVLPVPSAQATAALPHRVRVPPSRPPPPPARPHSAPLWSPRRAPSRGASKRSTLRHALRLPRCLLRRGLRVASLQEAGARWNGGPRAARRTGCRRVRHPTSTGPGRGPRVLQVLDNAVRPAHRRGRPPLTRLY
jgi:hypothetical protein